MVTNLLLVLALSYLGIVTYLYLSQGRMLFLANLPSRVVAATPADIGLAFDPLSIDTADTADGETLDGWYVPAKTPRGTLLFFHGNAGNISHRLDSIAIFHRLGLNVLIFDYRGYGRSTGKPSEQGTYRDAEAAWRHLVDQRGIPSREILLFGRSLGGAVATWLAGRVEPAGLIVESSFSSVPDMAAELYPWLPVRWLARISYDSKGRIGEVNTPVLIVHSTADEIIPFHHGQALFEAATEPKTMLEISGGHNDGFLVSREKYQLGIYRFLDQVFKAP
ncbi:alpha/beta hydrolase [Pseudomonadota bacterium]